MSKPLKKGGKKSPMKQSQCKKGGKKSPSKKEKKSLEHESGKSLFEYYQKMKANQHSVKFRFGDQFAEQALQSQKSNILAYPEKIKQAIREYTFTSSINKEIYNASVSGDLFAANLSSKSKNLILYLDTAIRNSSEYKDDFTFRPYDIKVYKGIKIMGNPDIIDYTVFTNFKQPEKQTGDSEFFEAGYMSTSTNIDNALRFSGDNCCLLEIIVPKDAPAMRIPEELASHGEEDEVLLPRNGKFVKSKPNSFINYYTTDTRDEYMRLIKKTNPALEGMTWDDVIVKQMIVKHYTFVPDFTLNLNVTAGVAIPNISLGETGDSLFTSNAQFQELALA
uniref:ADP ribosyltransferase domain-containing protein n=1 Tax=viral metagenome TaxID=1070528 RepID=A0A6C0KQ68_9ZZZZ